MKGFNYFKVSDLLLDTDIKKSELWVYLIHCRHRGIKSKGHSIAGLNATVRTFGNSINKKVYDKCINSLIDKGLIQYADEEIKKGFYKTDKAIKVIEGKKNIQIPIELLDKKIITNLKESEIKDIINLYSLYDPLGSFGGLDHSYTKAINDNTTIGAEYLTIFGGGFHRVIHGKKAYKIEYPTKYVRGSDFNIDLNKYIDMKLFKLKPVIQEHDPDDEDLSNLIGEVFGDLVRFESTEKNHKYITVLEDNQKVIWVLEPVYPIKNVKYREYLKYRGMAIKKAIEIYSSIDETTQRDTILRFIYGYALYEYIENYLLDRKDIKADVIMDLLEERATNRYKIDSVKELEGKTELLQYEIDKEIQFIEDENIRISREENRRRRHTTSTRLKELEKEYYNLNNTINKIKGIENKLIELIPNWVIDKLIINENNREHGECMDDIPY